MSDVAVTHARLASGWRAPPLPGGRRTLWVTMKGFRSFPSSFPGLVLTLEGHTFAGISVSQPMHDTLALIAGDNPWISCTPYVDEEHWGDVFNDQLYVSKAGPAAWTHLQLRKSDVLREIVFADAVLEEDADTVYETGAPGSPSSMHLIQQEFSARHEGGLSATSITREADELAKWLRKVHPKAAARKMSRESESETPKLADVLDNGVIGFACSLTCWLFCTWDIGRRRDLDLAKHLTARHDSKVHDSARTTRPRSIRRRRLFRQPTA